MKFTTHTLKNGLRIVFAPKPGAETAAVMVMSGTGARYESVRENGLAHFLEHMVFKGTDKRPNAKMIAEAIEGIGGEFNAFTSHDCTAYYAKVDKRHALTALDVVSDIFLHPQLETKEIQKERGTIIEEINMYEDMPIRQVYDVFYKLIFSDHPLGRTILGPKENIRTLARKDFIAYRARNYVAHNTVVVLSGAFPETKALTFIKKQFASISTATIPEAPAYTETQDRKRISLKYKKTDQTHFILGLPAYPHLHKDENALEVLAAILGGGMSSRLFTEVREKRGLAYYVSTHADQFTDTGILAIRAGVSNDKLSLAIKTCLSVLKGIKKGSVPKAELSRAKEYIKGHYALELESSDELARHAAYQTIVRGRLETYAEIAHGIDKVTAADVTRVAKALLATDKLNLAVIGPHKDAGALEALLKL